MTTIIDSTPEGDQQAPQTPQTPQVRASVGGSRGRIQDGQVEDLSGHASGSSGTTRDEAIAQGDWVRTANVAPSELTPSSIISVRVGNLVTTLEARSAEKLGMIRRGVHGYENVVQQQAQQQTSHQQNEQNQPDPEAEEAKAKAFEDQAQVYRPNLMNQEAEAEYAKAVDGIPGGYHASLAEALTTGDGMIPPSLLNEIAGTMPGVEPEQIEERARAAVDLLGEQVSEALSNRLGGNGAELAGRFRDKMPREFSKAVSILATHRSMRGFTDLADKYVQGLDVYEPNTVLRLNQNGFKGQRVGDAIRIVGPKGEVYSWAEALIRGAIRVKGYNGK